MILSTILTSCGNQGQQNQNSVNINVSAPNVPGFNINNFAQLLKTTKDPQSLEQAINSPNNNINNLDLNNDGQVDYLKVVESQNGTIQVIDDYSSTQSSIIATLTINQSSQTMNIAGSQTYCGDTYNYSSHFTVGDYLMMSYLLSPHYHHYTPIYHYGYYPSYYHHTTVIRTVRTVPNNYNSGNSTNRRLLSDPSKSQRSFQVRSNTPVRSGGFGSTKPSGGFGSSHSSGGFGSSHSS